MRFSRLLALATLVCAIATWGREAWAGPPRVTPLGGVPYRKEYLPGTSASLELCKVGQYGTPVGALGDPTNGGTIYFHEGDTYWTYIELRPDSCAGCGANHFGRLSVAHLALYFPFAPETVVVNVSVVASVPLPCHEPDFRDAYAVICPAFQDTLICAVPQSILDFAIPVPQGCVINIPPAQPGTVPTGPAFLGFEFVSASDETPLNKPQIAVEAAAIPCISWNPVAYIDYDIVREYGVGNPVMYAEVSQCESTPVRRKSWGELKLLYR